MPKILKSNVVNAKSSRDVIPAMTHILSQHWEQPSLDSIYIDDVFAYIDLRDFEILANYSTSEPSGVYEGKMWRSNVYIDKDVEKTWILRWFGNSENPNKVTLEWRRIIIDFDLDSILLSFKKSR